MRQAKRMNERTYRVIIWYDGRIHRLYLSPLHIAFDELLKALAIAMALPVSTAGCERRFSKLKIIKNHLRSTMADKRLNSLTVISMHRERRALNIDLDDVVDRFARRYPRNRIMPV